MKKLTLILCILLIFSCTKKGEDAIYILPEDYTGAVIILYNQQNGAEKEYDNNKRVYKIPENGILKTQFDVDYGRTLLPEFYYSNDKGQIPLVLESKDYKEDKINISMMSTGKSYKSVDGTSPVEFSTFFVGTKSQIESASKQLGKTHIADLVEQ
jgi:hypothetical protein